MSRGSSVVAICGVGQMPEWLLNISADFWAVLGEMAPYLLFGFLVAGVLSVLVWPEMIEKHLGRRGLWPVIKAAAFGVPLPLCSCGVIPVATSLRRHGASRGSTISFLIATPQDGVDSIMVTYGLLGGVFAIFRPLMALATGILGGVSVAAAEENPELTVQASDAGEKSPPIGIRAKLSEALHYGFVALPRDIGKALLLGLLAAALISALVPRSYFGDLVGPGIGQIVLLILVGIPVYVCATASVPLAYAMILAGVSPGAAFAFLMTGPATNVATIATIWKVMGKRTAAIYLVTMLIGALAGGLLLDQIVTTQQIQSGQAVGWMLPPAIKHVSAVVLLALLIVGIAQPVVHRLGSKPRFDLAQVTVGIVGMTCSHCAAGVRSALLGCPGVTGADVDLQAGIAHVEGKVSFHTLAAAVAEAGYAAYPKEVEGGEDG